MTLTLAPDAEGIARAAGLLRGGGLVAFPTETVYGLGADAADGAAVARVYAAKGRPAFNPLIVHLPGAAEAEAVAEVPRAARDLMDAFWPGPLTLVLPSRGRVAPLVAAGLPTVAIRAPAHPVARALLAALGRPLAAPSANPSGQVSPTTAHHVLAGLGGRIDAVLDGGPCPVGVESTILALLPEPRLLRLGGLPQEALEEALGRPLAAPGAGVAANAVEAPGQLLSHYAPKGTLRLNARQAEPGEVLLGFGPVAGDLTLSAAGDLREAAAALFGALHRLDAMGAARIAVAPVPERGLGRAINDRLRRAAAPRP